MRLDWENAKRVASERHRRRWPIVKAQLLFILVVSVVMAVLVVFF